MKNITSLLLIFVIGGICLRIHGGDSYDFFMISDTHFGTAERFCTDPQAPRHHRTRKDIHRADKAMPHYKALFSHIARSAGAGTKFLIEGGDLIEGCTVSEAAHGQELADAVSFMAKYFSFPIYMVKGNHEAAGIGGEAAYRRVLLPEIAKYAKVPELTAANYAVHHGKDLFVFLDYSSPGWYAFLESSIKTLKEKPRWLFVVTHCPLIPTWYFRKHALKAVQLISGCNGILLCGHHHDNTVITYEKDGKKAVQITVTTLLNPVAPERMRIREKKVTLDTFKNEFRKKAEAKKQQEFLPVFDRDWSPYITSYRRFPGFGYARFYVSDREVVIEYRGADLKSSQKVRLMSSGK